MECGTFWTTSCFSGRIAEVFAFVIILTLFLLDLWLNFECTYMGNITGYSTMWEWNSNMLSVIFLLHLCFEFETTENRPR